MASLQEMRTGNRIRLLQTLDLVGEADRAELARMTGLSRATVSGLLGEAIARGHVVESRREGAAPAGRRGRPAMLRLDPRAGMALDIELVMLGGEIGAASRRLLGAVRTELRKSCVAREPVAVRPALLGDRAESLGAVALALGEEEWLHRAGLIALNGSDEMAAGVQSSSERRVATG